MKRAWSILFSILFLYLILLWLNPFPYPKLLKAEKPSIQILSSDGSLLRQTLAGGQGGKQKLITLNEVSSEFIKLLLSTEDRRFHHHAGIDPFALARAVKLNLAQHKTVSGASTLTMQVARRALNGRRHLTQKIKEAVLALYLEMAMSKEEILTYYLNHLPFSNEIYGIGQASEVYFNKQPKDISLAESALLLAIIRAPTVYNPYKKLDEVVVIQRRILKQYALHLPDMQKAVDDALDESVLFYAYEKEFLAPHFTDYALINKSDDAQVFHTSLDLALNQKVASILKAKLAILKENHVNQASVLVISNRDAKIRVYLGSKDYWDNESQGMVDGVLQIRQPGSSLKPFTYATALDKGFAPNHLLADVEKIYPSQIGDYIPENYNRRYMGPVMFRLALANSLNVPAVELMQQMGIEPLYKKLKQLSFSQVVERPEYYGLGMTLGNVEASLFELVRAYSIFARQGIFCDLDFIKQDLNKDEKKCHQADSRQIFSHETVSMIRDFLSDRHARTQAFGTGGPLDFEYPVMIKTGTSQNYRDNWTVAVTPDYTIGVWVGNFNGDPMQEISGVTGAAPIAHAIVEHLYKASPWMSWNDDVKLKKVKLCALSGKSPTKHCLHTREEFQSMGASMEPCDFHVVKKIDKRNGFLASTCKDSFVQTKAFVDLPKDFIAWQLKAWPDSIAPSRYSPHCMPHQVKQKTAETMILSPQRGSIFMIDTHRPLHAQYLSLKTSQWPEGGRWNLNGKLLSKDVSSLPLSAGKHVLKLVGTDGIVLDMVKYEVR
jgi:penicillin-binding protein 1C